MPRTRRRIVLGLFTSLTVATFASCEPAVEGPSSDPVVIDGEDPGESGKGDIFGEDDRGEPYRYRADSPVKLATAAVGAQVAPDYVQFDENGVGSYTGRVRTMAERFDLCEEHPFSNQPAVASCTGFLVAPDVLVTAGHCLNPKNESLEQRCARAGWIFGFEYESAEEEGEGELPSFDRDDFYLCDEVIARSYHGCAADYSIVRLNRPVHDRTPLRFSPERPELQTDVWALGFPSGVPLKISPGGVVELSRYTTPQSFETTVDGFGGNSGGPVVTLDGLVRGIHVCGNPRGEYEPAEGQECSMPFECDTIDECVGMGTYGMANITGFLECLVGGSTADECRDLLPDYPRCDPLASECVVGSTCQWSSPSKEFRCLPASDIIAAEWEDCYFGLCQEGSVCRKQADSTVENPNYLCIPMCSDEVSCRQGTCQPAGTIFENQRFCAR